MNAFAMAKWVTGVNVTMSCVSFSRLKELGLKKTKIENTIIQFGSKCEYVVMGYLPFLKQWVECDSVPKQDYDSSFFFGGESMPAGARDFFIFAHPICLYGLEMFLNCLRIKNANFK
jgi:hypothetical protein